MLFDQSIHTERAALKFLYDTWIDTIVTGVMSFSMLAVLYSSVVAIM